MFNLWHVHDVVPALSVTGDGEEDASCVILIVASGDVSTRIIILDQN